jgi:hypothetical protein
MALKQVAAAYLRQKLRRDGNEKQAKEATIDRMLLDKFGDLEAIFGQVWKPRDLP